MSNDESIIQLITQVDDKHEEGHRRLRIDLRALEGQVDQGFQALREQATLNRTRIDAFSTSPVDVAKLSLTPKVVVAIVASALTIALGVWGSTFGLRSDVRDILTRMEAQKTAFDATGRLQELQSSQLKATVDDMKRRQELQQYEIQQLKELMLTGKVKP